ncbi:hypothetical protein BDA99DRAFT_560113 [Phascolomyces articulosus]|uniref:Uncharacterized protein n=1 Tax=Phascolomyces articulosus TaxID=60185 RepID=A0AAD5PFD2_9FUNG|nr:hypothetical protein BDA99DRAFT_560113 [Phascolomyces articulosus]
MSSTGSFGGVYLEYMDSYDLHVKTGQAMIALSAVTLIATGVQWYLKRGPLGYYILVGLGAFVYLIEGAIAGSLDQNYGQVDEMFPKAMASYFFGSIFPPIIWILVFYVFQTMIPQGQGEKVLYGYVNTNLWGTLAGYLWSFIVIVSAVGFAGTAGHIIDSADSVGFGNYQSFVQQAMNAYRTAQFINFGLWAYLVFYAVQMYLSLSYMGPILRTFSIFSTFAFFVIIGRTAAASNVGDESAAVAVEAVYFVFSQLFGLVALGIVLAFGHTWKPAEEGPVLPATVQDTEQQQQNNPSTATAGDKTEVTEQS